MTKFNYARSQTTASRLIDKFGAAGLLRRSINTGSSYDATVSDVDYAVTLVDMDYAETLIDGTQIQRGDHKIYMSVSASGVEPLTSDKLVCNGLELKVINVKPLAPAGIDTFWEIQARA